MKNYHQRKDELDRQWGVDNRSLIAQLDDEKRVFDLRFEATTRILTGMWAHPTHCGYDDIGLMNEKALRAADDLLKKMGVTE